ncbi:hypothetical protein IWW37_004712 [Coemansia sp. RSA 2050]|nr:hypothetical protein IWW37_004712 [Coemansia sp. RSA 2050]KAJ2732340.1 hypothetical protein IW152_003889 [Coemansia sp. BCRC 34962]
MNGSLSILRHPARVAWRLSHHHSLATTALHRNRQANYSTDKKKARALAKFPWIWPAEAPQTPKRSQYLPRLAVSPSLNRWIQWGLSLGAKGHANLAFNGEYIESVKEKMVGVVLQRVVDAINSCDYDALSQLMTPPMAKVYKLALANMKAQGYTLRIEVHDIQPSTFETVVMYLGMPESFDTSIPVAMRYQKYDYWLNDSIVMSDKRQPLSDGSVRSGLPPTSLLLNALNSDNWKSFQYRFNVRANVLISLKNRGKVVDSDSGAMEIPLALNTPFYEGMLKLHDAVHKKDKAAHLEPFRWYVSDLFNIAECNEHLHIRQYLQSAK